LTPVCGGGGGGGGGAQCKSNPHHFKYSNRCSFIFFSMQLFNAPGAAASSGSDEDLEGDSSAFSPNPTDTGQIAKPVCLCCADLTLFFFALSVLSLFVFSQPPAARVALRAAAEHQLAAHSDA
jgi:hypothetical protein